MSPQVGPAMTAPEAAVISRRMTRWADGLENPRPIFEAMIPRLRESEGQIFDSNGVAFGHPWAGAVAPERKTNPRLLEATGRLRRSLEGRTSESVQHATATELHYSTTVPYAHFHESGTSRMVARPFIGMTDEVRNALDNVVRDYSEALVRGGG